MVPGFRSLRGIWRGVETGVAARIVMCVEASGESRLLRTCAFVGSFNLREGKRWTRLDPILSTKDQTRLRLVVDRRLG